MSINEGKKQQKQRHNRIESKDQKSQTIAGPGAHLDFNSVVGHMDKEFVQSAGKAAKSPCSTQRRQARRQRALERFSVKSAPVFTKDHDDEVRSQRMAEYKDYLKRKAIEKVMLQRRLHINTY
jgi:hypothetical protein